MYLNYYLHFRSIFFFLSTVLSSFFQIFQFLAKLLDERVLLRDEHVELAGSPAVSSGPLRSSSSCLSRSHSSHQHCHCLCTHKVSKFRENFSCHSFFYRGILKQKVNERSCVCFIYLFFYKKDSFLEKTFHFLSFTCCYWIIICYMSYYRNVEFAPSLF